jgi:hypothetical protein
VSPFAAFFRRTLALDKPSQQAPEASPRFMCPLHPAE